MSLSDITNVRRRQTTHQYRTKWRQTSQYCYQVTNIFDITDVKASIYKRMFTLQTWNVTMWKWNYLSQETTFTEASRDFQW